VDDELEVLKLTQKAELEIVLKNQEGIKRV